jgi:hypothetical protein
MNRILRELIRRVRICIRINHVHITFVDVDRTRRLSCDVNMNNIRNRLNRRDRRINDVIDDESEHLCERRIKFCEFCESKIDLRKKKMTESKFFEKK